MLNRYFDSPESLAKVLASAAEAHHSYEQSLGHADSDWPNWYANYAAGLQAKAKSEPFSLFRP